MTCRLANAMLLQFALFSVARAEAIADVTALDPSTGVVHKGADAEPRERFLLRMTAGTPQQREAAPEDVRPASTVTRDSPEIRQADLAIEKLKQEKAAISYKPAVALGAVGLGLIALFAQDPGNALAIEGAIAGGLCVALGGYLVVDNLSKAAELDAMVLQQLDRYPRIREETTLRSQQPRGRALTFPLVAARF
jgi:hypothetical protein